MVMGSRDLFRGLTNEFGMPYSRDPYEKSYYLGLTLGPDFPKVPYFEISAAC